MTAVLSIQNVSKQFGGLTVVDDLSLDIAHGEFLAILGPSGCGKTTLLRMLGGFEYPTRGSIHMGERDITQLPPTHRPLNMVFQTYAIFPHMSVQDNVAYGLRLQKLPADEIRQRVSNALELVQMAAFAQRSPEQLSGGQRQRVALARAIVMQPKVLLLDEPLSALDAKLRENMQNELVRLQHTIGITFVVVTHDQNEALSMATRIAVMNSGKILQIDSPHNLYDKPNCRFVADFIGRMNILPCAVVPIDDQSVRISLFGKHQQFNLPWTAPLPPSPHYLGIRPERLQWRRTPPVEDAQTLAFAVRVQGDSYYGNEAILHCQLQSEQGGQGDTNNDGDDTTPTLMANCLGGDLPPPNATGWLQCQVSDCVLFSD